MARGLAIGAVDLSLVSPVQRRVNCSVGPWENVSNGGSLLKKKKRRVKIPYNESKEFIEVKIIIITDYKLMWIWFKSTDFFPWKPQMPTEMA